VEDEVPAAVQRKRGRAEAGHECAGRGGAGGTGRQEGEPAIAEEGHDGGGHRGEHRPRGHDGEERPREGDGGERRPGHGDGAPRHHEGAPGQPRDRRHAGRAEADDGEEAGAQDGGDDAQRRPRPAAVDVHP
jgi:hypothetical protein